MQFLVLACVSAAFRELLLLIAGRRVACAEAQCWGLAILSWSTVLEAAGKCKRNKVSQLEEIVLETTSLLGLKQVGWEKNGATGTIDDIIYGHRRQYG
jgi:hypothetical protein